MAGLTAFFFLLGNARPFTCNASPNAEETFFEAVTHCVRSKENTFCVTLVLTRASSIKTPASDNSQRFLLCIFRRLQILILYSCEFELIILNLLRRYRIRCSLRYKNCQNPEATIDLLVELIFLLERLGCKENCWHRRCLTSQKQERIQYLHSLFIVIFVSFLIRLLSFHNYPFCVIAILIFFNIVAIDIKMFEFTIYFNEILLLIEYFSSPSDNILFPFPPQYPST